MDEVEGYGPKMLALTEKQRRYVLAMLSDPLGNPTAWAREAGYADNGGALIRKTAHFLAHDNRLMEAAQEEARRHLDTVGPVLGIGVMMQIARNPKHRQQLQAAQMLADRVAGFAVKTEHRVTVEHRDDGRLLEFARRLAGELGIEEMKLVGQKPVIEQVDEPPPSDA